MATKRKPFTRSARFHAAIRDLFNWAAELDRPVSRKEMLAYFEKRWDQPQSMSAVLTDISGHGDEAHKYYTRIFGKEFQVARVDHGVYRVTKLSSPPDPHPFGEPGDLLMVTEPIEANGIHPFRMFLVEDENGASWVAVLAQASE